MDKRSRMTFYAVCGAYLLYMAYQLFKTVQAEGVEKAIVSLVFSILFLVGGIFILIMTYRMSRDIKKEEAAEKEAQEAAEVVEASEGAVEPIQVTEPDEASDEAAWSKIANIKDEMQDKVE